MSSVEATSLILLKGDHPLTTNIRQRRSASHQYWLHHSKSSVFHSVKGQERVKGQEKRR